MMDNLWVISSQFWDVIKIIIGGIFGAVGIKAFEKWTGKKREALEMTKLYREGSNLELQVKTNLDKIIEEKTKSLQEEIVRLSNTIINISTRATSDRKLYTDRISDLELKIDNQIARNKTVEDNLEEEIKVRQDCVNQLKKLQERVFELEKASPTIVADENNNPQKQK